MSATAKNLQEFTLFDSIKCHPAWHGDIPGIYAEQMFEDRSIPYVYMIRQGEASLRKDEEHYYITFVLPDQTIKHQPLVIHYEQHGWRYTNGRPAGLFHFMSLDPVLHEIMHCEKDECIPLAK